MLPSIVWYLARRHVVYNLRPKPECGHCGVLGNLSIFQNHRYVGLDIFNTQSYSTSTFTETGELKKGIQCSKVTVFSLCLAHLLFIITHLFHIAV